MKVLIGSANPAKIQGAREAFECYFEDVDVVGIPVESGVSEQPENDEIYLGAKNRVNNLIEYARKNGVNADYFVAIESGITDRLGEWLNLNVAYISDGNGGNSIGSSNGFPIPDRYIPEIREKGLGKLMEKLSGTDNIAKQFGGVYFLTKTIKRSDLTKDAFVMALTKFINGDIWSDSH